MGCNSCRIVRDSTALSRAFAAIGLLRLVKAATPPDLICTYILQSGQPCGFRCYVDNTSWHKKIGCQSDIPDITDTNEAARAITFPPGLAKMAKGYLARMFWKNVRGLVQMAYKQKNEFLYGQRGDQPGLVKMYPKEVCNVLNHIRVHSNSILWDARNAISDLHAVVTPTLLDKPTWKPGREVNLSMFAPLSSLQTRNLDALSCVLDNYCWNTGNQNQIPNDAEKTLLLDLVEAFIMMNCGNYPETYRRRQTYEYARVGNAFSQGKEAKRIRESYLYRPYNTTVDSYSYEACVNNFVETLKHSSPEAAICMTVLKNPQLLSTVPQFSKPSVAVPINEVTAYLAAEICVEREKCETVDRLVDDFRRGRYRSGDGCGCCCEDPVEECAPCAAC